MRAFRCLVVCTTVALWAAACGPAAQSPTPVPAQPGVQAGLKENLPRTAAIGEADAIPSTGMPAYCLADLMDGLRALGFPVVATDRPVDHGFAVEGVRVLVEDAPVFVYEFAEAAGAQSAATNISTDEYSMTIVRTEGEVTYEHHSDWLDTPHVYLRGRVIVIAGDHPRVLDALETLLGPRLAPKSSG